MEYEIPIPLFYRDITEKHTMRATMFKRYVLGYIEISFPELKPLKIDTKRMVVICEKRQG